MGRRIRVFWPAAWRGGERHEADGLGGDVQDLGETSDEILAAEDRDDLAVHEQLADVIRDGQCGESAHDAIPDERLQELCGLHAFGRIEGGLVGIV